VTAAPTPHPPGAGAAPKPASATSGPALLWLRADLRLHDNPALAAAARGRAAVLPVCVLDPRDYRRGAATAAPPPRFGPARAAFTLAAVSDLRSRLRAAGSDLLVRVGRPEDVLPPLARAVGAGSVVVAAEVSGPDRAAEGAVSAALAGGGGSGMPPPALVLVGSGGAQLYEGEDLPQQSLPDTFSGFAEAVAGVRVRPPSPPPARAPPLPRTAAALPAGPLPTVAELCGCEEKGVRVAAASPFQGGESAGLARLAVLGGAPPATAAAGAAAVGALGPWLAAGCLSARRVAAALGGASGAGHAWAPLAWRDYWRLAMAGGCSAAAGVTC